MLTPSKANCAGIFSSAAVKKPSVFPGSLSFSTDVVFLPICTHADCQWNLFKYRIIHSQLPLIKKEKQTSDDFFLFLSVQELGGVKLCAKRNKKFLRLFSTNRNHELNKNNNFTGSPFSLDNTGKVGEQRYLMYFLWIWLLNLSKSIMLFLSSNIFTSSNELTQFTQNKWIKRFWVQIAEEFRFLKFSLA